MSGETVSHWREYGLYFCSALTYAVLVNAIKANTVYNNILIFITCADYVILIYLSSGEVVIHNTKQKTLYGHYSHQSYLAETVQVMILIYIIIALLVLVIYLALRDQYWLNRSNRDRNVLSLLNKANKHLKKLNTLKLTYAKVNNCKKALHYLYEAQKFSYYKEVIDDYDKEVSRIRKMIKVLPLLEYIDKADCIRLKTYRDKKVSLLIDAICYIKLKKITDADIIEANIFQKNRDVQPTIENILDELSVLGENINFEKLDCYAANSNVYKKIAPSYDGPIFDIYEKIRISTVTINMLYTNSKGEESRRVVDVKMLLVTEYGDMFYGYCHLTNENRKFRVDRAKDIFDIESGEVIDDLKTYLLSKKVKREKTIKQS